MKNLSKHYVTHLIAFIDILGFKELIEKTNTDLELAEKVLTALTALKSYQTGSPGFAQATTFSDCILLSAPLENKPGVRVYDPFMGFFNSLMEISCKMLLLGFPIRGAVTVGKLYHEDNIIFGEGAIRAYQQESTLAEVPRIIVDQKTLDYPSPNLANNQHLAPGNPLRFLVGHMGHFIYTAKDSDGRMFVDFLGMATKSHSPTWGPEQINGSWSSIKEMIIRRASEVKKDPHKFKKWVWLANYFNFSLKRENSPTDPIDIEKL